MIKSQLPQRSSTSSVVFWFLFLLSILLSFIFSSLFLLSGWASSVERFGGFHVFWGQSVRGGVACFAAAIFLFICVVYWLWFSLWKREGVALNLKALLLSRWLSALMIDTLNLLRQALDFGRRDE